MKRLIQEETFGAMNSEELENLDEINTSNLVEEVKAS